MLSRAFNLRVVNKLKRLQSTVLKIAENLKNQVVIECGG